MSRQYSIRVVREYPVPVEQLFSHLAEHENLARLFAPAKVVRIRNGDTDRNGVGSARRMSIGPLPAFIETVTAYRQNELVEYRITQGSPLRNHLGTLRFTPLGPARARVDLNIIFEGRFPLVGALLRLILQGSTARGLDALEFDRV